MRLRIGAEEVPNGVGVRGVYVSSVPSARGSRSDGLMSAMVARLTVFRNSRYG